MQDKVHGLKPEANTQRSHHAGFCPGLHLQSMWQRTCLRLSFPKVLTVSSHSAGAPGTVTHRALPAGSSGPQMPRLLTSCTCILYTAAAALCAVPASLSVPTLFFPVAKDVRNPCVMEEQGILTSRVSPAGERPQPIMAVTLLKDAS